ncbi:hypothetical protein, partial [Microbacterium oleivorans]|uniref:hypothetical protein n=1 Tax=Microbacterium oleivorans TaxID=273677 RepID=UPI00203BD725
MADRGPRPDRRAGRRRHTADSDAVGLTVAERLAHRHAEPDADDVTRSGADRLARCDAHPDPH